MKTELANKKQEILNWIFKSKDGASWNEVSEMLNEFEKICKDEDHVIKAKALRKKGTDDTYIFDYGEGNWYYTNTPHPYEGDVSEDINDGYFPSDADLVDIEIRVIEPNK